MIAQIAGEVLTAREHDRECEIVVGVGGIGYRVAVTPATLSRLPAIGELTTLYTYLHVREEGIALYGFESIEERDLFEVLISASGVGPKVGLAILATHSPRALRTLVSAGDAEALTLVPGIGAKRAQKLLLELRDKISGPVLEAVSPAMESGMGAASVALAGLGYSPAEIREALTGISADEPPEVILREALRTLGRSA